MHKLRFLISAVAIAASSAAVAAADTSPSDLQFISLYNNGGYTIKTVTLKWKSDGVTSQKRFTSDFGYNEGFCVDLSNVNEGSEDRIPTGAEVWLVAEISGGDTQNCRKDKKHYYKKNNRTWSLLMGGTTLNNNSCKNSDKIAQAYKVTSGNSTGCGEGG